MTTLAVVFLFKFGWLPALNRIVDDYDAGRNRDFGRDFRVGALFLLAAGLSSILAVFLLSSGNRPGFDFVFKAGTVFAAVGVYTALLALNLFYSVAVRARLVCDLFGHLKVLGRSPSSLRGEMSQALTEVLSEAGRKMNRPPTTDDEVEQIAQMSRSFDAVLRIGVHRIGYSLPSRKAVFDELAEEERERNRGND